jgi:hypothetical protein
MTTLEILKKARRNVRDGMGTYFSGLPCIVGKACNRAHSALEKTILRHKNPNKVPAGYSFSERLAMIDATIRRERTREQAIALLRAARKKVKAGRWGLVCLLVPGAIRAEKKARQAIEKVLPEDSRGQRVPSRGDWPKRVRLAVIARAIKSLEE